MRASSGLSKKRKDLALNVVGLRALDIRVL